MTLPTPDDKTEKAAARCRFAHYLWLLPLVTAAVAWGVAESLESRFTCPDMVPELLAVVIGALIGVFISSALKEHCDHASKDPRN
jgi:hypothetical protein